jgi:hypothetical protein
MRRSRSGERKKRTRHRQASILHKAVRSNHDYLNDAVAVQVLSYINQSILMELADGEGARENDKPCNLRSWPSILKG